MFLWEERNSGGSEQTKLKSYGEISISSGTVGGNIWRMPSLVLGINRGKEMWGLRLPIFSTSAVLDVSPHQIFTEYMLRTRSTAGWWGYRSEQRFLTPWMAFTSQQWRIGRQNEVGTKLGSSPGFVIHWLGAFRQITQSLSKSVFSCANWEKNVVRHELCMEYAQGRRMLCSQYMLAHTYLWVPKDMMSRSGASAYGRELMDHSWWYISICCFHFRPSYSSHAIIKGESTVGHQGVLGTPRHPDNPSRLPFQNW